MIARCTAFFILLLAAGSATATDMKPGRFLQPVVGSSPVYEKSLRDLLRSARTLPAWVRNMVSNPRYVSGASEVVTVDGRPMELFGACPPRQCTEAHMRVLFDPEGKAMALLVQDPALGEIVVGKASPEALLQLRRAGI